MATAINVRFNPDKERDRKIQVALKRETNQSEAVREILYRHYFGASGGEITNATLLALLQELQRQIAELKRSGIVVNSTDETATEEGKQKPVVNPNAMAALRDLAANG